MNVQGYSFTEEEFKSMPYKCYGIDILKTYPNLKFYEDFTFEFKVLHKEYDTEKVLRYIFLMYQKTSPLNKIQEIDQRKLAALELAGLGTEVTPALKKMIGFQIAAVNAAVTRLFMLQGSMKYEVYISMIESFSQMLHVIREPVDTSLDEDKQLKAWQTKAKLKTTLIDEEKAITELAKELFGPTNQEVAEVITAREKAKMQTPPATFGSTPEAMAAKMAEKQQKAN